VPRHAYISVIPPARKDRAFQDADPNGRGFDPGSSIPVSPWLALVGFVGLCLLVGAADSALTSSGIRGWYLSLARPPGTPPNWAFAPVWMTLYVLIGVAGWLVWRQIGAGQPIRLWGWQLAVNAAWNPAFFGLHNIGLAMAVIVVMLAMTALTIRAFARVYPPAAWLMAPYLAWTCFAAYLNAGFWWLNG
jgi:tryptophan-rich sensory protein